jgi:5'-phosphate synthase pdxT subunit
VKVGVLALQGDVEEHAKTLAELGAHPVEVRTPEDLAGLDALVLPGGESTTLSLLLESSGLFEPVRQALREGMPAFGTCAGMILLASEVSDAKAGQRSMGAIDIGVRRNAFGRQRESFECQLELRQLPGGPFPAVFIRAPVVERVGPGAEVLAELPAVAGHGRPVAVAVRQGQVLVTAFHPELSGDLRVHQLFLSAVEEGGR